MTEPMPDTADARRIAEAFAAEPVVTLERYPTGLCHFVYRVDTESGARFVLRVARPENANLIRGGLRIGRLLAELGLPVARPLGGDASSDAFGFPWMVVDHLPGDDLGTCYDTLSGADRARTARAVADIQLTVRDNLAASTRYGWTTDPSTPPSHSTWPHVLRAQITRSRDWLKQTGLEADEELHLVERRLAALEPILREVRPLPFLDDLTTKNVLVHDGRLSGIVDTDELCYGDPLLTTSLTRMSLRFAGRDDAYADELLNAFDADACDRERSEFYTGLFALIFLSEQGMTFNRDAPDKSDERSVAWLRREIRRWLR